MLYGVHAGADAFLDSLRVRVRVCRDLDARAVRFLHPWNEFFGYVTVSTAERRGECRAGAADYLDGVCTRDGLIPNCPQYLVGAISHMSHIVAVLGTVPAGVRDSFACRQQTWANVLARCEAVAQREDFVWAAKVTDGREARLKSLAGCIHGVQQAASLHIGVVAYRDVRPARSEARIRVAQNVHMAVYEARKQRHPAEVNFNPIRRCK